jgi:hypothetical protein
MADGVRGEVTVRLGDQRFVLVPRYHTFAEIQRKTGIGCFKVAELLEGGAIASAVDVLSCADPKRSSGDLTEDRIFEAIMENGGVMVVVPDLYRFVLMAFTGHQRMAAESQPKDGEVPEAESTKSAA